MEGTAEADLHALSDPLPDRWVECAQPHSDADRHHLHLLVPYKKMHGLHGLSPKWWEGVAKTETIFWL